MPMKLIRSLHLESTRKLSSANSINLSSRTKEKEPFKSQKSEKSVELLRVVVPRVPVGNVTALS